MDPVGDTAFLKQIAFVRDVWSLGRIFPRSEHEEPKRKVVCAAIRQRTTGILVCGPRHAYCRDMARAAGLNVESANDGWEEGFVDQECVFMDRRCAWRVADAAGQILSFEQPQAGCSGYRRPNRGDTRGLASADLY